MVYKLVVGQHEDQEAPEPQETLEEYHLRVEGRFNHFCSPDDIYFYPCCAKFIHHDTNGWEVDGPDA
ncbi:hypothetical protein SETIT_9G282100v2 [Setaria italica]|uniref:Uncharacterized protein n=1 Tax=Setaria italica TaxID=4555 RepID=A0A368SLP8_SETIT|nr:hypothetical protein SETIT_9G282100v2 [Setaria italica]